MKKIALVALPPALEQAFAEHFLPSPEWEVASFPAAPVVISGPKPDLVVTAAGTAPGAFAGCPLLPLPLSPPQRLGSLLRLAGQILAQPSLYIGEVEIGPYVFRPQERALSGAGGREIPRTDRETDILAYLARYAGEPVSRDELLRNVWQYQEGTDTHTLETHIYRLRQKIEEKAEEPRFLLTATGGYSLRLGEK